MVMTAFKVDPHEMGITTWHEVEFGEDHEHFANRRIRVIAADPQAAIALVQSMTADEIAPMVPARISSATAELLLNIFPVKD